MTPAEMKDANRIAEAARQKIARSPHLERDMRAEFAKVEDRISDHAAKSEDRWKVYEVHHMMQAARLAMLTAFIDGKTPQECAAAALERVGITARMERP